MITKHQIAQTEPDTYIIVFTRLFTFTRRDITIYDDKRPVSGTSVFVKAFRKWDV